jgi:hypothetical protein
MWVRPRDAYDDAIPVPAGLDFSLNEELSSLPIMVIIGKIHDSYERPLADFRKQFHFPIFIRKVTISVRIAGLLPWDDGQTFVFSEESAQLQTLNFPIAS